MTRRRRRHTYTRVLVTNVWIDVTVSIHCRKVCRDSSSPHGCTTIIICNITSELQYVDINDTSNTRAPEKCCCLCAFPNLLQNTAELVRIKSSVLRKILILRAHHGQNAGNRRPSPSKNVVDIVRLGSTLRRGKITDRRMATVRQGSARALSDQMTFDF